MPFVIEAVGPPLSWREVPAGYQLGSSEVAVVDTPPQPEQVWDGNRARNRTSAEALALTKDTKRLEMERMFAGETSLIELSQALVDANGPQAAALRARVGKLNAKKSQVDAANNQAAVNAVGW